MSAEELEAARRAMVELRAEHNSCFPLVTPRLLLASGVSQGDRHCVPHEPATTFIRGLQPVLQPRALHQRRCCREER